MLRWPLNTFDWFHAIWECKSILDYILGLFKAMCFFSHWINHRWCCSRVSSRLRWFKRQPYSNIDPVTRCCRNISKGSNFWWLGSCPSVLFQWKKHIGTCMTSWCSWLNQNAKKCKKIPIWCSWLKSKWPEKYRKMPKSFNGTRWTAADPSQEKMLSTLSGEATVSLPRLTPMERAKVPG